MNFVIHILAASSECFRQGMDEALFWNKQCRIVSRRPVYSGNIMLIIRDKHIQRRTAIFMKLFDQCPKHYAALYREKDCEFQYGFFDSNNCIVRSVPGNDCQFDVIKSDSDSGLRFETPSSELPGKWMEAFHCNKYCAYSPRNRRRYGTLLVKSALLDVPEHD